MASDIGRRSDQFDIRLNVLDEDHLADIVRSCKRMFNHDRVRYIHCSNVEIGDVPGRISN